LPRFAEISIAQYNANLDLDTRRYNRLFDQMMIISDELKRRPGDHRRYLSSLYQHPNTKVRAKAAIHTLAVLPEEARKVLEEVGSLKGYSGPMDARGILRALDEGTYVPE
jgi:hypothetical protein